VTGGTSSWVIHKNGVKISVEKIQRVRKNQNYESNLIKIKKFKLIDKFNTHKLIFLYFNFTFQLYKTTLLLFSVPFFPQLTSFLFQCLLGFMVFYAVLFGFREPPWAIRRNVWRNQCCQIMSDKRIQLSSKAKDARVVWMNLTGKNRDRVCSKLYIFWKNIWNGW